MNIQIFLENYGAILAVMLIGVLALVVYQIRSSRPSLTGPAAVVSRRAEPAKYPAGSKFAKTNNWNYLVTFRLSDGEELELYTSEAEYHSLEEGQYGQLTWNGDNFCEFFVESQNSL